MLNRIKEIFKSKNRIEFDIEVNEEEVLVLKQGVVKVVGNMLNDIASESNIDKIKVSIDTYNEANSLLELINEEIESKLEEINVNKIQIDILLEALNIIEIATTNNLKLVEDSNNYKNLCKTMVIVDNLMERIVELM